VEENLSYAEENVSTQQPTPRQDARLPRAHGDEEWPSGAQAAAREGAQAADAGPLLRRGGDLPRSANLKKSSEFRVVYESGRRYDGAFMTAFVAPAGSPQHRLGITASRKVSRSAVGRNRVKRLLRESFRLSQTELKELRRGYDWVLNAKRSLLEVKLNAPLDEFRRIIERVARDERTRLSDDAKVE
jgi:ribonuclease P protein component